MALQWLDQRTAWALSQHTNHLLVRMLEDAAHDDAVKPDPLTLDAVAKERAARVVPRAQQRRSVLHLHADLPAGHAAHGQLDLFPALLAPGLRFPAHGAPAPEFPSVLHRPISPFYHAQFAASASGSCHGISRAAHGEAPVLPGIEKRSQSRFASASFRFC